MPTAFEWEIASSRFSWGQCWEWTVSAYHPYPEFSISDGAVGEYNGKFMVNQMVLRGASVATIEEHSRATYRNFFHPHFQWQYSGIRLVK
ncbi:MAG: SUMF1/EgtB/PvdO family nonheme iron enzyme [Marinomonas sp.]